MTTATGFRVREPDWITAGADRWRLDAAYAVSRRFGAILDGSQD